jgi:hypothetical protein
LEIQRENPPLHFSLQKNCLIDQVYSGWLSLVELNQSQGTNKIIVFHNFRQVVKSTTSETNTKKEVYKG